MKALKFEVTDELYEAFQQMAALHQQPVETVALQWLSQHLPRQATDVTRVSEQPFQRCFGTWESGQANSADNDAIDADLVREYADDHLPEA